MRYFACAAMAALCVPLAHAGRPLTTDDAGVLDRGTFELETYMFRSTERETPRTDGWHIHPAVGLGFNSQIGVGYGSDRSDGETSRGFELDGKTFIKELTDDSYGVAVSYGIGEAKAAGDNKYRYDTANVTAIVTVPVSDWLLHGNLGWGRSRLEGTTATNWALAAERPGAFGPVDLAFEVWGDDHAAAWGQIDARWNVIPERLSLDCSFAQQADSQHAKMITVGLKFTY
ncbi:MAG: hypothetical protein QM639_03105 [Rhodocyclaceae bacterium]